VEVEVWNDLKAGSVSPAAAFDKLLQLRDGGMGGSGTALSARSCELLSLESEAERAVLVEELRHGAGSYSQLTLITCMDSLRKDSDEANAVSLLVVGTEAGQLMVLPQDPSGSAFLCKVSLPSPPVMLSVAGMFDVEWRVTVICRDGKMYSVKNGDARGSAVLSGTVVDLGSQAVAIAKQDKFLWVATMERTVTCYSNRGKRLKGLVLSEEISEMCVMALKRSKVNYVLLIALASGELCMYKDLTKIYSFNVEKPVVALCYGTYGREENSLIVVHAQGALTIKMWRRTAEIDSMNGHTVTLNSMS
jgi:Bardet-Biedl syndrome 1 protein